MNIIKRVFFVGGLLFLSFITYLIIKNENKLMPEPTEIVVIDNGEEDKLARDEWIEQMHLTAPGDDWREIDRKTRKKLRIERNNKRKIKTSGGVEEIAGGELTGEWIEKGSKNLAGRMHNIDVDVENQKIYGASDGGQIWRGGMSGENWISLSDHYQVKGVHYFRVLKKEDGSNRIVQTNTRPVFRYSDDEGENWQEADGLSAMSGARLIRGVNTSEGKVFLLFTKSNGSSYIYRSDDIGSSFSLVDSHGGSEISDIWISRYENGQLFFIDRTELFFLNNDDELEAVSSVGINFSKSEIKRLQLNGMIKNDTVHLFVMYRLENSSRFLS